MGARGPLPKPKAIRQNRNPHALVVIDGAKAQLAAPPPPDDLTPESIALWAAFWSSDVALAVDRGADMGRLERWIRAVDEWRLVGPVFREQRVTGGSQGQPRLNPLAVYLAGLEANIATAETQFGMTPASRARLGLTVGQAKLTAANLNAMLTRSGHAKAEAEYADEFEPG